MKNCVGTFLTIVLVNVGGWATNAVSGSAPLAESIARADSAYRSLPVTLAAYNVAVREICEDMQPTRVSEFKSSLKNLGVSFASPNVRLPLRHVEVPPSPAIAGPAEAGVPVVAGYDTRGAPLTRRRVSSWMPRRFTTAPRGTRDFRFGMPQPT